MCSQFGILVEERELERKDLLLKPQGLTGQQQNPQDAKQLPTNTAQANPQLTKQKQLLNKRSTLKQLATEGVTVEKSEVAFVKKKSETNKDKPIEIIEVKKTADTEKQPAE